jgi:hypothetical protein
MERFYTTDREICILKSSEIVLLIQNLYRLTLWAPHIRGMGQ